MDISGERTSRPAPAVGKPQSLQKWKHQVKIMTTRITVIRRFGRKYSTKSLQCSIAPGLTTGPSQLISQVQELIEKSNSSEGTAKKNQPAGRLFSTASSSVPTSAGAQFSPQGVPSQDAPHQMVKRITTLETKNGEGFFTDHRALAPALQILLVLVGLQILKEADLLDASTAGLVVIVTVIVLPPGTEGTTATIDRIMRVNICTLLALLLSLSSFVIKGVHGQDESEDREPEHPNQLDKLPYNVKAAAGTILAALMMIAAVIVAGNTNRRRLVTGTQATASADPAVPVPAGAAQSWIAAVAPAAIVPVPAAAPHVLPPLAGALPVVPALAVAPPAAIVPVPAAAPHALPPPVGALPAVPALAAVPPPAIVPVPAAAPHALPPLAGALPVVPALAVAPPAAIVRVPAAAPHALPPPAGAPLAVPALAAVPPAAVVPVPVPGPLAGQLVPPAAPAGQGFDIMGGLLDNLDAQFLVIYDPVDENQMV